MGDEPGAGVPIRVGVVCDYPEERWASMDLVAEMILDHLARRDGRDVVSGRIRPPWSARFARLPVVGSGGFARNADRLINRHVNYPRQIRALAASGRYDLFHLADHSYAQLVHALPAGRCVVTCHDLDAFRCLLDPAAEPRPAWFRALARRTLTGLQKAAAVACDSQATRSALLRHGLVPEERLRVVHLAVPPEFRPEPSPEHDAAAAALLGPSDPAGPPEILHVGSNIPRKRIDVLLEVFAAVRRAVPGATLVKVGGPLAPSQTALADALGVSGSIRVLPYFDADTPEGRAFHRATVAAVYRRAALVLQPSDAEGFGLPVAEALACGAAVLASDLPVLREVGGDAAEYRPVAAVSEWVAAALPILDSWRDRSPSWGARRAAGLARAAGFGWGIHVDLLAEIYRDVLAGRPAARPPVIRADPPAA